MISVCNNPRAILQLYGLSSQLSSILILYNIPLNKKTKSMWKSI
jgi:hypothetical protein